MPTEYESKSESVHRGYSYPFTVCGRYRNQDGRQWVYLGYEFVKSESWEDAVRRYAALFDVSTRDVEYFVRFEGVHYVSEFHSASLRDGKVRWSRD